LTISGSAAASTQTACGRRARTIRSATIRCSRRSLSLRSSCSPRWSSTDGSELRRVEPAYVPAPACLLAFTAWQLGRGALARVAVDRALAAEPGHELAGMLHQVLGFAISPGMVSRFRPSC
jgi:hypothetical protein